MSDKISIGRIVQVQIKKDKWRPAIVVDVANRKLEVITATIFLTQEDEQAYRRRQISQMVFRLEGIYPGDDVHMWRWPPRI